MIHDKIKKLSEDGTIKLLIELGLMSPKIMMYIEIYAKYTALIQSGHRPTQAIILTSMAAGVTERTVYRAVKVMRMHQNNANA